VFREHTADKSREHPIERHRNAIEGYRGGDNPPTLSNPIEPHRNAPDGVRRAYSGK